MASPSQKKLLTEILNLASVRVTKYQNISGIGLIIHLEPLTKEAECDRCGQISHQVHQNHRYLVKDLPISGQAVYLEVNRRQFKCKNCGKPFSVKGQGNYCAVLIDIEQSKVIALLEERTQEKIIETLSSWGTEILEEIEFVSIDLWKPYKSLAEKLMSNATVVADRFHVMKQINEELDKQRKTEKRTAEKEESIKKKSKILSGLTKSKYALLKNECNLNEQQKEKLEEVKKVCPTLGKMHELKEKFRDIYEQEQSEITGLLRISDWLKEAAKYYPDSKKTIMRWIGEIIGYFKERITATNLKRDKKRK